MKIVYGMISIFLVAFFPKLLTDTICFGRHRDKDNITSKAGYWGIYFFWFVFFVIACLVMGAATVNEDSVIYKISDYFMAASGKLDYAETAREETDTEKIFSYYTKKDIDKDVLLDIIKEHQFEYRAKTITTEQVNPNLWTISAEHEVYGYVKVKKGFFIKKIRYVWNKENAEKY